MYQKHLDQLLHLLLCVVKYVVGKKLDVYIALTVLILFIGIFVFYLALFYLSD